VIAIFCIWFFGLVIENDFTKNNFDVVILLIFLVTLFIVFSIFQSKESNKKILEKNKKNHEIYINEYKKYQQRLNNYHHQNNINEIENRRKYENGDTNTLKELFLYIFHNHGFDVSNGSDLEVDIEKEKKLLTIKFWVPDEVPTDSINSQSGYSLQKNVFSKKERENLFWDIVSKISCMLAYEVKQNLEPWKNSINSIHISGKIESFEPESGKVVDKEILKLELKSVQIFEEIHFESKVFNPFVFVSINNKSINFGIESSQVAYHVKNRI
jgi:hypothetical protein